MYLIRLLVNFAVFCVFLWISRDFADLPEFRSSVTAQNIWSRVYTEQEKWSCKPLLKEKIHDLMQAFPLDTGKTG